MMVYGALTILTAVLALPMICQPRKEIALYGTDNQHASKQTLYRMIVWMLAVAVVTTILAIYMRSSWITVNVPRVNQEDPGWSFGANRALAQLLRSLRFVTLIAIACASALVAVWLMPRLSGDKRSWVWGTYLITALVVLTGTWGGLEYAYRWGPRGIYTPGFWETYGFSLKTTSQGHRELRFSIQPLRGDSKRRTEALKLLSLIPNLRWLSLTDYELHDEDMIWVARVPSLEMLSVNKNPITSDGLRHIAALPNLKACYFGNTDVDDKIIPVLLSMEKLTDIFYSGSMTVRSQEVDSIIENRNPEARKQYLRDYNAAQKEFRGRPVP